MDQQVFSNFKKLYAKGLFQLYLATTMAMNLTSGELTLPRSGQPQDTRPGPVRCQHETAFKGTLRLSKAAQNRSKSCPVDLEADSTDVKELDEEHSQ